MRFLYKRPKIEDVHEELTTMMEVMVSDLFIIIDLFWLSFIFTLLLLPALHSVKLSLLFFFASFGIFNGFYFIIFNRLPEKS